MSNNKTIECKLFTWSGWDQLDTAHFIFYNPVLVVDIGEFKAGTKLDYASVDYEHSVLELSDGEIAHKYNISLFVGDKIDG